MNKITRGANWEQFKQKSIPSDSVIMPEEIYQVGFPITIVNNECCWGKPKDILYNLNPWPNSRTSWGRSAHNRTCIILKIIATRCIPLAMPLPHISSPSWCTPRHGDKQCNKLEESQAAESEQNTPIAKPTRRIQFYKECSKVLLSTSNQYRPAMCFYIYSNLWMKIEYNNERATGIQSPYIQYHL